MNIKNKHKQNIECVTYILNVAAFAKRKKMFNLNGIPFMEILYALDCVFMCATKWCWDTHNLNHLPNLSY